MSKRVRPTHDPKPPVAGTKGYIRVLQRGCGGYKDSYSGEYDCRLYQWPCDDCPVCIESQITKELEWFRDINSLHGPPRNLKHPFEFWDIPAVSAELVWMFGDEAQFTSMVQAAMELPPKETNYAGDFRAFILGN